MPSANKTLTIGLSQYQGNEYQKRTDVNEDNLKIDNKFKEVDETLEANATQLSDMDYQVATGTGTAIVVQMQTLRNGYAKTFIASANNGGVATKINGKSVYKPGTTTPPNFVKDKAYTVWYNAPGDCFFIKASAEGTALAKDVRKNTTFSNDNDTGMPGGLDLSLLVSGNLRAGVTIDGVIGKTSVVDTADATAVASNIVSTYTAYKNGAKITGTATIESLGGKRFFTGNVQCSSVAEDFIIGATSLTKKSSYITDITGFNFIPSVCILVFLDGTAYVYCNGIFHSIYTMMYYASRNSNMIATMGRLRIPIEGDSTSMNPAGGVFYIFE